MSDGVNFAGQVKCKQLDIVTWNKKRYDIRLLATSISIFEDIFSNVLTGQILIEDKLDLIYNWSLMGEEHIEMEYITPTMKDEDSIKCKFQLYKISDLIFKQDGSMSYVIHFISHEAIIDINKKISRPFKGRISSNIARMMSKDDGLGSEKPLALEETSNVLTFISNFWSPFEIINYMTQRALTVKNSHPSFLFFETNKRFVFASWQELLKSKTFAKYTWTKETREPSITGSTKNLPITQQKILKLEIANLFDYLDQAQNGMYAGKLLTHNITSKTIKLTTFDYMNSWHKEEHLGDKNNNTFPLHSKDVFRTNLSGLMFRENAHYVYGGQISDKFQMWLLRRRSILQQLKTIALNIEIYGRTDIEVGNIIELDIPIQQHYNPNDSKDTANKRLSGKYIVSAIHHRISQGVHMMNCQIIKDGYGEGAH